MKKVQQLIEELKIYKVHNAKVLKAFENVPREAFVLPEDIPFAYENRALPIQCNQTISQPYIIGLMTQALLEISPMNKVLEIGTGSGYQAAILAHCVPQVYTIERIEKLHKLALSRFQKLQLNNIHALYADGFHGWKNASPFDGILITAAPEEIPQILLEQLNPEGGRMVVPVGSYYQQELLTIDRKDNTYHKKRIELVSFVPFKPGTE